MAELPNNFQRIHFVGIKGVGMSALAQIFHNQGAIVSGSDTDEEFPTDKNLMKIGINPLLFDENNITEDLDCVVYSSAYKAEHPEIQKAKEFNIPIMDYGEALARLFNQKKGIVISGTHGKTTTTAMLAKVFEDAGLEPCVLAGGEVLDWQNNMRYGEGDYFIAEGDEYQGKFLNLKPEAVLLTNIDYDHPDFFPDFESYKNVFRELVKNVSPNGICVISDDARSVLAANGSSQRLFFSPELQKNVFGKIKLKIPGYHNRLNALAVFVLAREFSIDEDLILGSLAEFSGVKRRLEYYSDPVSKILIVDDYAHHPAEIKASIKALKETFPQKELIAAFQPHTFSRTVAFLDDFACAFDEADRVAIADIYASCREEKGEITSEDLIEKLKDRRVSAAYTPGLDDIFGYFAQLKNFSDGKEYIFLTMGAGDIWKAARRLKEEL